MAPNQWERAEIMAGQASAALREASVEDIYATPLGEMSRRRVSAQRLRSVMIYALPYFAIQVRLELIRVHLAWPPYQGPGR
jgi:hypothetical protein